MTREELLELARRTPDVGSAKHADFVDYLVPVESQRPVKGEWKTVESAYMTVVGKLAMANHDHRAQAKQLNFEDPVVLVDNDEQLTLMVVIVSEIYGRRHGIATSRRVDGSAAEREYPWEVAETSAIGRALGAMGYGALAGAGLASAEDMQRVQESHEDGRRTTDDGGQRTEEKRIVAAAPRLTMTTGRKAEETRRTSEEGVAYKTAAASQARRASKVSKYQHDKLVELYGQVYGTDAETAEAGVDAMFQQQFGHGLEEATYNEGAHVTARLLSLQRQAQGAVAAAS